MAFNPVEEARKLAQMFKKSVVQPTQQKLQQAELARINYGRELNQGLPSQRLYKFLKPQTGTLATAGRPFVQKVLQGINNTVNQSPLGAPTRAIRSYSQGATNNITSGLNTIRSGTPNKLEMSDLTGSLETAYGLSSFIPGANALGIKSRLAERGLTGALKSARTSGPNQPAFGGLENLSRNIDEQLRAAISGVGTQGLGIEGTKGMALDFALDPDSVASLGAGVFKKGKTISKGFTLGRSKNSKWHPQDVGLLDQISDFVNKNKEVTVGQFQNLDKEVTRLAQGYLPVKVMNKLAADYGSNEAGYLKALVKQLQKSTKFAPDPDYSDSLVLGLNKTDNSLSFRPDGSVNRTKLSGSQLSIPNEELTKVPNLKAAQDRIRARLGKPEKAKFSLGTVKKEVKSKFVDAFSPIEDTINTIEKKGKFKLLPEADPRLLRNRVLGVNSIAGARVKQGLLPVFKGMKTEEVHELTDYMLSKRALEVNASGRETGIDSADAQQVVTGLAGKYEAKAQQLYQYQNKLLQDLSDSGIISKDLYTKLTAENKAYIPLNRLIDKEGNVIFTPQKQVASVGGQKAVLKLKGSEKQILDPLAGIVEKTYQAQDLIERNRIATALVNLRKLPGFEDLIKEGEGGPSLSIFENGVKRTFQTTADIERAAKSLGAEKLNFLIKLASIPTRVMRLGLTGVNLPFALRNLVKDQIFATITSDHAMHTSLANPLNFIKSFASVIKQDKLYDDFLAAGAGNSNFFSVARNVGKETIEDLRRSQPEKIARTIINPTKWLGAMEDFVGITEQATRVQQFRGTKAALKAKGIRDPMSLLSLKAARENTTDFAKKGEWGSVLNNVFIFSNAGIQGSRTLLRNLKQKPGATALKLAGTVFAPLAAVTAWNMSDPERKKAYLDIPEWERDSYFIVLPPKPEKTEDGYYQKALKIPITNGIDALAKPIRSMVEYAYGNGDQSIGKILLSSASMFFPVDISDQGKFVGDITPTALSPLVENYTNKKFFFGGPIVPRGRENAPPQLQYSPRTTATFKKLGELTGQSPAKLENIYGSFTGQPGKQLTNWTDRALVSSPVNRNTAEEVQKSFTMAGTGGLIDRDYDKANKVEQAKFALKELRPGVIPKEIKDNERTYLTADYIFGKVNEIKKDDRKTRDALVQQFAQQGLLTPEVQKIIKQISKMDEFGVDKSGRELLLYSPSYRAKKISESFADLKDPKYKEKKFQAYLKAGIITPEVIEELKKLRK